MSSAGSTTAPNAPRATTKWGVLAVSVTITLVVTVWSLAAPQSAGSALGAVVSFLADWFGWFYITLATAIVGFVAVIGMRYRRVRLGAPYERPEFSTFSWAAMLFAAGIGTDVMFFAVAGPVAHYLQPPRGAGESLQAAKEAAVWTLFHYGITGWAMYTLMGIALGYHAHRKGLPLAVRSALHPLIGRRIEGPAGGAVDVATIVGTVFGIATSLGIAVVMLNVGLDLLVGVDQGLPAQIGLVAVAVIMAGVSAVSGVGRGIRLLSQLRVLLGVLLCAWVLLTGNTTMLLRAITMNVGDFVALFPGMTMDTMAFDYPAQWMNAWTLFFWAWWIAWASFVGLFLARISRGRTIGQFVVGTMTIPFIYIVMWICIFGNSAIDLIRNEGNREFARTAMESPESGFYTLLQHYPGALFLIGLATVVGLLSSVTSSDSGALVMANLSSRLPSSDIDARWYLRVLWAVVTGVLTVSMLIVGGISALQNATIVMALPFAFVLVGVMVGLTRSLEGERLLAEARSMSLVSELVARRGGMESGTWRNRLSEMFGVVSVPRATAHFEQVILPALEATRAEFETAGAQVHIDHDSHPEEPGVLRTTTFIVEEDDTSFRYQVRLRRVPAPSYGAGLRAAGDTNTRVEVDLAGLTPYDIISFSQEQVCEDLLDAYQRHRTATRTVVEHAVE